MRATRKRKPLRIVDVSVVLKDGSISRDKQVIEETIQNWWDNLTAEEQIAFDRLSKHMGIK